jgi:hypothetical protein
MWYTLLQNQPLKESKMATKLDTLIAWINNHDCGVTPTAVAVEGGIEIRVQAVHADGSTSVDRTLVTCYSQARDVLGY